jgi:hypothetical protein
MYDGVAHFYYYYYSALFFFITDAEVQVKREQKRVAMSEYYAKHGGGAH